MNVQRFITTGHLLPWFACLLFLILASLIIDESFLVNPDSARYLIRARSLSSFEGFKDNTTPFPEYYVPHAPLYSVALAPVVAIFQNDVLAAKWATALMGVFFLFLFFRWSSRWMSRGVAGFATIVLALNPLVVLFGTQVLSDIPFMALVVLIVRQFGYAENAELREKRFLVLVALLMAAVVLREVGWVLAATVALMMMMRRRMLEAAIALLGPGIVSAAWYYRNEILVAPLERPALQKISVLFSHFHTVPGESMVSEFWARALNNIAAYGGMMFSLIFVPDSANSLYPLPGIYDSAARVLPLVQWVLIALPAMLVCGGIVFGRREPVVRFLLLFSSLYVGVLLIYPYVDVRLVLVLIVPFVSLGAYGFERLFATERSATLRTIAAGVMVLCLIPNVVWVASYAVAQRSAHSGTEMFSPRMPYSQVGRWVDEHLPKNSILASWRKEMALWTGGRKMVHLQRMMVQDEFEALLRDENIEYIVSVVDASGLRDIETEMALSTARSFQTLMRIGDLEVVRVIPSDVRTSDDKETEPERTRRAFRRALHLLHTLKTADAAQAFQQLLRQFPHDGVLSFYYALACGMSGEFDEARTLLGRLKQFSQTSAMIGQVHYHEQLLERVRRMNLAPDKEERVQEKLRLAFDYWYIGFRRLALQYLRQAAREDLLPAFEAGAFLFVVEGDTATARWMFQDLKAKNPQSYFVPPLERLYTSLDSLGMIRDPRTRSRLRATIARSYLHFALLDEAINELQRGLAEDRGNPDLLEQLGNLYLIERRSSAALRTFEELVARDPDRPMAREKLEALRSQL